MRKTSDGWKEVPGLRAVPSGSGEGGTTNYNELQNKPQINGEELTGNKTAADLGLATAAEAGELRTNLGTLTGQVTELAELVGAVNAQLEEV